MNIASTVNATLIAYATQLAQQQAAAGTPTGALQAEAPRSGPADLWMDLEAIEASRAIPTLAYFSRQNA